MGVVAAVVSVSRPLALVLVEEALVRRQRPLVLLRAGAGAVGSNLVRRGRRLADHWRRGLLLK